MSASVLRYPSGNIECRFTYSAQVVEQIKLRVPSYARIYDPATRAWSIDKEWAAVAIGLLYDSFEIVEVTDAQPAHQPTAAIATDPDLSALYLAPGAPRELVSVAFKTLAKMRHPDRGGSTSAMQRLNEAYSNLQARGMA